MSDLRLLLCTDLDRTLLPNGAQPESLDARRRFTRLVEHPGVTLVYVTGRDRGLVQKAITNYRLPQPDFVLSDVGTNIYALHDGEWQIWDEWHKEIAPDWKGYGHRQLSELLSDIGGLRLQPFSKQNTFKLSYYVPLHMDQRRLDRTLEERLQAKGIEANLIWSVDEPAGIGLLDVLPRRASKLHALEFLRAHLGIDKADTLFAGDSGNDLPVLASSIPSVLVANAMPSMAEEALAAARAAGNEPALYLARGGFMNMNGNYSAGILEGVNHFHPQLTALFET